MVNDLLTLGLLSILTDAKVEFAFNHDSSHENK
jgi:hypothetical protein